MDCQTDQRYMDMALERARRGQGFVEPNPMVGCVIVEPGSGSVDTERVVGCGWHQRFGGDHAEIHALREAGDRARGATMYVTLEPCCHHGKTPPCTDALVRAGVARVVVAQVDPNPLVRGTGIAQLRSAAVQVDVGCREQAARALIAPYRMLTEQGRPWVIAKWAMTLDGKLATREMHSRWISSEQSREIVQRLRGRVDAIVVGANTARVDDPLLTARPVGPRIASRVVVDSHGQLASGSRLVQSAHATPVLIAVSDEAVERTMSRLESTGCEVIACGDGSSTRRLRILLKRLAAKGMTNVLIEGGGRLLGSLWDAGLIDEVHVFVAPKLVGGSLAPTPLGGHGLAAVLPSPSLIDVQIDGVDGDVYINGMVDRSVHPATSSEDEA